MTVYIVKLNKGIEKWEWLCGACIASAERDGWHEQQRKKPPHALRCQGCNETADERSDT